MPCFFLPIEIRGNEDRKLSGSKHDCWLFWAELLTLDKSLEAELVTFSLAIWDKLGSIRSILLIFLKLLSKIFIRIGYSFWLESENFAYNFSSLFSLLKWLVILLNIYFFSFYSLCLRLLITLSLIHLIKFCILVYNTRIRLNPISRPSTRQTKIQPLWYLESGLGTKPVNVIMQ